MPFIFKVQMLGLCHFVENSDPNPNRPRLCVLLPGLGDDQDLGPKHLPRLIYNANHLKVPPIPPYTRLRVRPLIRERVTFRLTPAAPLVNQLPTPLSLVRTQMVRMSEIGSTFDTGLDRIVSSDPPDIVAAQIFLGHGTLKESKVGCKWDIPRAEGGSSKRVVPGFVHVEEAGLSQVEVTISSFGNRNAQTQPETLVFESGTSKVIALTLTADCSLTEGLINLIPRPAIGTLDKDFAAHYRLLSKDAHDGLARKLRFRSFLSMFRDSEERLSHHVPRLVAPSRGLVLEPSGEIVESNVALGGSDCQNSVGKPQSF